MTHTSCRSKLNRTRSPNDIVQVITQVIKNLLKNKIMVTVRTGREVVEGQRNELAADVEVVAENFSGRETVTGMVLKKQFKFIANRGYMQT